MGEGAPFLGGGRLVQSTTGRSWPTDFANDLPLLFLMVYAFQAELAFSTATRRDQVETEVNARLGERNKWGVTIVTAHPMEFSGEPALSVLARLTVEADLNTLVSHVEGFLTGPRLPTAGYYAFHSCPHDQEELSECVVTRRTYP